MSWEDILKLESERDYDLREMRERREDKAASYDKPKRFNEWDAIQQNIDILTDKIESLNRDKERIQNVLGYGVSSREEYEKQQKLFYELDDKMVELIYQRKALEQKLQERFK